MKKILNLFGVAMALGAVAMFASCSDSDDKGPLLKPYNEITAFSLTGVEGIQEYVISDEDATVEIHVAADFDKSLLVDVTPSISISVDATISPDATEKQDFSKQVNYTVTAEDGTARTWKVYPVVSQHVSSGFRANKKLWFTQYPESAANENTVAVIGDYLIASRSAYGWNRANGTAVSLAEVLNVDGMVHTLDKPEEGYAADHFPFIFVNDDAGNLVGCNLNAWNTNNFYVYVWTSIDAAPKILVDFPLSGQGFGRKLVARGDVAKGNGYISAFDYNSAATDAKHYFWKVTNGTAATTPEDISSGYVDINGVLQMLIPDGLSSSLPAYLMGRGHSGAAPPPTVSYISANQDYKDGALPGALDEDEDAPGINVGWGNHIIHGKRFEFNNKTYMSALILRIVDSGFVYYTAIYEKNDDGSHTLVFKDSINSVAGNGNYTGSIEVSQGENSGETKTMNLYVFASGTGVQAYEFSNLYSY